jgi:hypothetical protein
MVKVNLLGAHPQLRNKGLEARIEGCPKGVTFFCPDLAHWL